MVDLVWHKFLEIGVDFIDEDHRALLKTMQETKNSIEAGDFKKASKLLDILSQDAAHHFQNEEEYLKETKYPDLLDHKHYHRELLLKIENTRVICEQVGSTHELKECFNSMANFLIDDILRGDIMFKSYLQHEGYIKN